jgi:hypothetical protein
MAQAPFNLSIQRVADYLGRLLAPQRALKILSPLTAVDVPGETLRGPSGSGEVTGYTAIGLDASLLPGVITSRIVTGTAPIRVNGGNSADLGAGNITLTIEPATVLAPGSMSAADKALLDAATVDPTPSTLLRRGPSGEGKCTSFELSSGGQLRANIAGDFVNVASVDGAKAVQIGDTLQVASITMLAKANGNIAAAVDGTGALVLATIGASSKIAMFSNSFENLHAENRVLSVSSDDLLTFESTVGNYAFTANGTMILSITKQPIDPAPLSTAVIASDGDISLNGIHALTLNGGSGGTQSRIEISDAGTIILQVNATEVARFDAGGPPAPQSVGTANSVGISTELALADHVHDHGTQALGTGTQHAVATTSFAGFMSATDKTKLDALSWQTELGANGIANTTATRYLATGYNNGTAGTNPLDMPVAKPFKIDSLRMFARVAGAAGQTITATIRKNGATVGTATLATASDATTGSSTFTAVSYAAGDTWGLQIDKSGNVGSPTDVFWSVGMTPP